MHCRAVPPRIAWLLVATWSATVGAGEDPNRKRIEAMPREQRVHLSENLDRFDALPAEDRSAIRLIDAEIAKLDPLIQARYLTLLRRYHVWLSGLGDAQRLQLEQATSLDAKIALIDAWRKAEKLANTRSKSLMVLGVHPGDLGTMPPFEMANALKVWLRLDAKEQTRIETINPIRARIQELTRIGRVDKHLPMKPFSLVEEEAIRRRIEAMENLRQIFPGYYRKVVQEKVEAKRTVLGINNPIHNLTESLYFIEHPPTPVSVAHLVQFDSELPPWFRSSLDPLPPEDARRRLAILYRQIYESPAEIPAPKKTAPAKAAEKPKMASPKSVGGPSNF